MNFDALADPREKLNPFSRISGSKQLTPDQQAKHDRTVKAVGEKTMEKILGQTEEKTFLERLHELVALREGITRGNLTQNETALRHWFGLLHTKIPSIREYRLKKLNGMVAAALAQRALQGKFGDESEADATERPSQSQSSSVSKILHDRIALLEHIERHPQLSFQLHYEALKFSKQKGANIRRDLQEQGLIDFKIDDGERSVGRPKERGFLTEQGAAFLRAFEAGIDHAHQTTGAGK